MKKWLCVDCGCVFAKVAVLTEKRPISASSQRTQLISMLSVFCEKKHSFVRKHVSNCGEFQNMSMEEFIKRLKQ